MIVARAKPLSKYDGYWQVTVRSGRRFLTLTMWAGEAEPTLEYLGDMLLQEVHANPKGRIATRLKRFLGSEAYNRWFWVK